MESHYGRVQQNAGRPDHRHPHLSGMTLPKGHRRRNQDLSTGALAMIVFITYDITDPRRLVKVVKIMMDYGTRVQKSIFEITVKGSVFLEMKERIERLIVPEEDGVKYFPVCEKCAGTVEIIGLGQFTDPDEEFYVY